jgi:hypothetical protein
MSELVQIRSSSLPSVFLPEEAKIKDAKAGAIIEYAKNIKDWPLLMQAVEAKLEEQRKFVRWWDEKVARKGADVGRGRPLDIADRRLLSVEQAEQLTGINKQQVSKWRKRLQEPEKYREILYGTAYRKAMAEAGEKRLSWRDRLSGRVVRWDPARRDPFCGGAGGGGCRFSRSRR